MNRNIFLFLALFLVLLSGAFALPSCDLISATTYPIDAVTGTTVFETFIVSNNNNERFFLDSVYITESDGDFSAKAIAFDREILAGKAGSVAVKVTAFNDRTETGNATMKIRGHFINGLTCYFDDLPKTNFNVNLLSTTNNMEKPDCESFELIVDKEIDLSKTNLARVYVSNLGNKTVNVRLSGADLELETNYLQVKPMTQKMIEIEVHSNKDKTWIYYNTELQGCFFETQNTTVLNGFEKLIPVQEIRIFDNSLVDVKAQVKTDEKGFIVEGIFSNKTDGEISGTVSLELPEGLESTSKEKITLKKNEVKTIQLLVVPNEKFSGNDKGNILFSFGEKIAGTEINFYSAELAGANLTNTGFVSLFDGAVIFGLLLVAIVLITGFVLEHKKAEWETEALIFKKKTTRIGK